MTIGDESGRRRVSLGGAWSLEDLEALAIGQALLELGEKARAKVKRDRAFVDELAAAADAAPNVYGVNTGFGALAETRIDAKEIETLEHNLLRSHAAAPTRSAAATSTASLWPSPSTRPPWPSPSWRTWPSDASSSS